MNSSISFPAVEEADPSGLLGQSVSLTAEQAFTAYCRGIFPWPENADSILWWAPDPRAVIYTDRVHVSRSLHRQIRKDTYAIRYDHAFDTVIDLCATRHGHSWITPSLIHVYRELFAKGRAHSCELWQDGELRGGLYGVCLDRVFCGESMFSLSRNASKIVLVALCRALAAQEVAALDIQFISAHLRSMGGEEMPRAHYQSLLGGQPDRLRGRWRENGDAFAIRPLRGRFTATEESAVKHHRSRT